MKGGCAVEFRNCRNCGRPFLYQGNSLCPACRQAEEEDYEKVKAYLNEHPKSNLEEIHQATGVSKERILSYLRQGRLEAVDGIVLGLQCGLCGRPIKSGRVCVECAREMASVTKTLRAKEKGEKLDGVKMHIQEYLKERRS